MQLRAALPGSRLIVGELTAPEAVLKERVTAREPNEYWQNMLRSFVDLYHRRNDLARIRDFQISTYDRSVDEAAHEAIDKMGWQHPADGRAR